MNELERRYVGGTLEHNNNPVLNWAMSNVVATKDPAGNIKADKSKAQEKIDPALGVIMAVGAMISEPQKEELNICIG
jgi:phage terminase large subunit-like protein